MRFADVFRLALATLWRQKTRTVLTTLGVVCASFALVGSLSVGQGIQETIMRQITKYGDLRKIEVRPGGGDEDKTAPVDPELQIKGDMSADRRERLQAEMKRRHRWDRRPSPKAMLTEERIRDLEKMEHVRSAVPGNPVFGRAILGKKAEGAQITAAPPDDDNFRGRVIAGGHFSGAKDREALATEFLLYQLGVVTDADLEGVVGRKLRLEFRPGSQQPNLLLTLLKPGARPENVDEEALLGKVIDRLPNALDKLDLTSEEAASLKKMLGRKPERPPPTEQETVVEEYTIRGVLRTCREDEVHGRWDYIHLQTDVLLPPGTAEDLIARLPGTRKNGFDSVLLEVDDAEHVKEVSARLKEMGFTVDSLLERIEVERFIYLLIFSVMSMVAAMALAVSALGICNTMLMGVLERVREIGVMKAVGARDGHIQMIFLVEGFLIGLAGGLLGLLLAWLGSGPGDAWVRSVVAQRVSIKLEESVFVFPLWLTFGAPAFACVVTTLAAVYPARQAARVNPVKALRHE